VLVSPTEGASVPAQGLTVSWAPVTQTLTGGSVNIISYQVIVEKDELPHPHMIGKLGLSVYLPASASSLAVPDEFLEPATPYQWEVLAIEESGNQTLLGLVPDPVSGKVTPVTAACPVRGGRAPAQSPPGR
jgi:hypothetical protein